MNHTQECQEPGCTKPAASRGLCRNHYATWYYKQKKINHEGLRKEPSLQIPRSICRIMGCNQPELNNYLCKEHVELLLGSNLDH